MRLLMSVTASTSASNLTSRYGSHTVDYDGAEIRAHCRHLAIVVTIHGRIDAGNVHRVTEHVRRFVLAHDSVVLDLSGVTSFAPTSLSLLDVLDEECLAAGVDWTLVAGDAVAGLFGHDDDETVVPIARSVREALHNYADVIATRRRLMLPLIKKTA
jgi:anti-anti-sigma regulatory factor